MADYFPGGYWPVGYFPAEYWGGGEAESGFVNMSATMAGSGSLQASAKAVARASATAQGVGSLQATAEAVGQPEQPSVLSGGGGGRRRRPLRRFDPPLPVGQVVLIAATIKGGANVTAAATAVARVGMVASGKGSLTATAEAVDASVASDNAFWLLAA